MFDGIALGIGSLAGWETLGRVAWQTSALLALGLLAAALRPMRPSRAHRILLASAFAGLAVVPASLMARRLDLGLFAARSAIPTESPAPASRPEARPIAAPAAVPGRLASGRPLPAPEAGARQESRIVAMPPPIQGPAPPPLRSVARPDARLGMVAFLAGWAALSSVGLIRLLASFRLGMRLKDRAAIVTDPAVLAAAGLAARRLGLAQTPEVRSSVAARCPVVWCWGRRPVLILPANPDVSPSVLCHELAHWKRGDHLSALVGEILVCVLPWQPLAWAVRGRMADLSELACDDWALTHAEEVSAPDYAEALLGLAADRRRPLVPAAVSRRSGLAARIRHILEEDAPKPRPGRAWSALLIVLAVGVVGVLALAQTRTGRAMAQDKPAEALVQKAAEPASNLTTITGTVSGPDGAPLADVELIWTGPEVPELSHVARSRDDPEYGKLKVRTLARGRTDAQGKFSLSGAATPPKHNAPWSQVIAHKPGLAPGSGVVPLDGKPIEIHLDPPVPIVGRLLTPGGEPAAGVVVRLTEYSNAQWRDPRSIRIMNFGERAEWDQRPAFFPPDFRTDAEGRFRIDGFVPADVFAGLRFTHPDFAVDEVVVATGASTKPTPDQEAFSIRPLPREFGYTLAPARPVVGRITDAETKEPLAGVTVEVTPMGRHGGMPIRTRTDAEGRYRISDREGQMYFVGVFPASDSGYLPGQKSVNKWPTGESELRMDFALRKGVVVRGRVVDEVTGRPIAGAGVVYQATRGNKHVRQDDDFRNPTRTDQDGRFAIGGARGPGVIAVEGPSSDYIRHAVQPANFSYHTSLHVHGLARFDYPEEGVLPEVTVKLRKGRTLEARAVKPDGTPLPLVKAWCPELSARLIDNWTSPGEFADGLFRLPGAEPGRVYRVFFIDPDLKYGKVAEIKFDPDLEQPVEVRLDPTASLKGRVLAEDGQPLEGAQILPNIQLVDKGDKLSEDDRLDRFSQQIYTQFSGEPLRQVYPPEFDYKGLIPGVRYFVTWHTPKSGFQSRAFGPLRPGEALDAGDLRTEPKKGGKDAK